MPAERCSVAQLKEATEKEQLTWRSFADPGTICRVAIAVQWNLTVTPTVYVIDASGVIRCKWLGESDGAAVDAAIHALIAEAKKR
jgi:peroxiredoxin